MLFLLALVEFGALENRRALPASGAMSGARVVLSMLYTIGGVCGLF